MKHLMLQLFCVVGCLCAAECDSKTNNGEIKRSSCPELVCRDDDNFKLICTNFNINGADLLVVEDRPLTLYSPEHDIKIIFRHGQFTGFRELIKKQNLGKEQV